MLQARTVKPSLLSTAIFGVALMHSAHAQTVTDTEADGLSVDDVINTLLGGNLDIESFRFTGEPQQLGVFSGFANLFDPSFDQGILLSTGKVSSVVASPNTDDESSTFFSERSANDDELGRHLFDLAKLEIQFTPAFDTLTMDFIFGSEEYNEWVHSPYNDRLQILVNGENCARTPDNQLFSINTVNDSTAYPPLFGDQKPSVNPELYINNDPGKDKTESDQLESPSTSVHPTEMDGFTRLIRCTASVNAGEINRLVIGLADIADPNLDSWTFIRAGSLSSLPEESVQPDADRDGIPDSIEAPNGRLPDTDGDGVVDMYDLDSDNDGIPDSVEYQGDQSVDVDMDGLRDDPDAALLALAPVDTDNDGWPDIHDYDSDGDTLTDLLESLSSVLDIAEIDANDDGVIDDATDRDNDGLLDVVDPSVPKSTTPGQPHELLDLDNDGLYNYRDVDSDGDQFEDDIENGDFDRDGTNDRLQPEEGLKTAVSGVGSFGPGFILLLPLLLLFRRYR